MRKHNLQPDDSVTHKHFKNCFGHVKALDGDEYLLVEWEDQDRITACIRGAFSGDPNKYPGEHIHYQHVVPAERCVFREGVEDICWRATAAFQNATTEEGSAIFELFEACDEVLSHVHRSPKYPDGRLSGGYDTPAYAKLREITDKFPRLKSFFEHVGS